VLVGDDLAAAAACKHATRVRGTVEGVPFQSSLNRYADGFHLLVPRQSLEAAGIPPGSEIAYSFEPDPEPPGSVVPADFQAALDATPGAASAFARLSPSHRREHVKGIEEAKQPGTRARRIARAVQVIGAGEGR
jgi:hypothetical protein